MTRGVVALTGGTGFIGRVCAAALAADGWRVRLLIRRDPTRALLANPAFELVTGDLADEAALVRLVRGAAAVVHAAGTIRGHAAAAFLPVNREATRRLAAVAAREALGCRFVLLSSQAARAPHLSPYASSKFAGETAARAACGSTNWVILRPGVVVGAGDDGTRALLRLANLPLIPVPAPPEPVLAMIHVADVAGAVVAFCAGGPSSVVHELSDGAGHGWREIVNAASRRQKLRFVTVPDAMLLAAGRATDALSIMRSRPALFGYGKAREILHRNWRPDPALAPPPELWRAAHTLVEALRGAE